MKIVLALAALLALAACGAAGDPAPPATKTGVSVTGDVQIGVTG